MDACCGTEVLRGLLLSMVLITAEGDMRKDSSDPEDPGKTATEQGGKNGFCCHTNLNKAPTHLHTCTVLRILLQHNAHL